MSYLSTALRLLFFPTTIEQPSDAQHDPRYMRIGLVMGLVGLMVHSIFIWPADEIHVRGVPISVEVLVNGVAGALVGCILFFLLLLLDAIILGASGARGFKSILYGSYAPLLAIPLACIPIHAIFSNQLSARGYAAIVFVLIVVFLAWHALVMGINLVGHFRARSPDLALKRAIITTGVLFALELIGAIIFMTQFPLVFDATFKTFMEDFF